MRSIILIGHRYGDLLGAELQALQRKFGIADKQVRYLTKNPRDADHLDRLRKRAKVALVLAQRQTISDDPQLPFEPLEAGEAREGLAPLMRFSYEDLTCSFVHYVHRPRLQAAA